MFRLILKRLLLLIPVLIGVTFLVFAILSLAPGDPVLVVLGDNATEEAAEAMRSELGLDKPFLERYTRPSMTCFNYFFNLIDEDRPTYDLKVRQAICYAIDRQKIIDTILQGSATLADSMIAPIVACYTPTPTYDYDLEKAKQLMAESSYPNGCDLIMVTNQSQQRLEICQVVQQMLKELNINVEIRTYEQATYIQALNEHEHDMGFSAWITSTGDADYTYYPCYHSTQKGKPGNRSFFGNPKADELIEKGRSLSDPEARKEVYSELNQIIYENCTQLYICHPLTVEACTKYVEGLLSLVTEGFWIYIWIRLIKTKSDFHFIVNASRKAAIKIRFSVFRRPNFFFSVPWFWIDFVHFLPLFESLIGQAEFLHRYGDLLPAVVLNPSSAKSISSLVKVRKRKQFMLLYHRIIHCEEETVGKKIIDVLDPDHTVFHHDGQGF